jgi:hypothetical protein
LSGDISEDAVWRADIIKHLSNFDKNVFSIWYYSFTEIFNNAIEHSGGSSIKVSVIQNALTTTIEIADDGIGIFRNIKDKLNLADEREAVVELTKGKVTTDPNKHSGEGIFFTSRMVDSFFILSGEVQLFHDSGENEDWIFKDDEKQNPVQGSNVIMKLNNKTERVTKNVFDKYTSGDDYGFNNTIVPVKLAEYDGTQLISRSQAKRILSRLESFKSIVFDFNGVENIGQAFADEIFRVFAFEHPQLDLQTINTNPDVRNMINRALANLSAMN